MELSFTCVPAAQGCPHGCLLQSRFPGDADSRGAPPIGVASALAFSFAALSIGGVWAMMLDGTRTTLPMYSPAVLQIEVLE